MRDKSTPPVAGRAGGIVGGDQGPRRRMRRGPRDRGGLEPAGQGRRARQGTSGAKSRSDRAQLRLVRGVPYGGQAGREALYLLPCGDVAAVVWNQGWGSSRRSSRETTRLRTCSPWVRFAAIEATCANWPSSTSTLASAGGGTRCCGGGDRSRREGRRDLRGRLRRVGEGSVLENRGLGNSRTPKNSAFIRHSWSARARLVIRHPPLLFRKTPLNGAKTP